jgi:glycerophosphoryl diester phosphodiesterase
MRIAAHRGTRLHAPENSRNALLAGYTAGADVLELDLQLTADGELVVSHDGTTDRLTGTPGRIIEMTLAQLRALDFSATFRPRGSDNFEYYHSTRRMPLERFPLVLEHLPEDVELLLELKHDSSLTTGRRDEFVGKAIAALTERGAIARTVVYSKDPDNLREARRLAPELRVCAFDYELAPDAQLALMTELGADGLVTDLDSVLAGGALTAFGARLEAAITARGARVGACLYPYRQPGLFTRAEWEALRDRSFVWSLSTDSMLDVAFVRRAVPLIRDEAFAGKTVDRERFALGYAKANRYGRVFQDDGVHVDIAPYDQPLHAPGDALERRLHDIENKLTYTAKDWPYYSGGGVGVLLGIRGDFVAEVDYTVVNLGQATTLEMAVMNVDPGAHRAAPPESFRDKDSFYDPHGAPPYVGVEHDEADGFRINWNFGAEYDNNQYGPPVGDGATPHAARLRLERRGDYFAAYYRNDVDARDWVCVGAVRNESMNRTVFLRCVGKRWRQEDPANPSQYMPILANHFVFKNLDITRFL